MRIQHNIMAMNAYRNYNNNTKALAGNLEKLSSGYKINRAGDDAAGLAISEKMRAQITGLDAAQKNVKDGISLVKTAEGAMQEIQDMLNRMEYLATQSANGTYQNDVDREALQKEVVQLKDEINRIADSANFNGIKLLDGSQSNGGSTSGVQNITKIDMQKASSALDAVKVSYVTNRPASAAASAGKASFKVSLDDVKFSGASGTSTITISIGGQTISISTSAASMSASAIVNRMIASGGKALGSTANSLGSGAGAYVQLGDHVYKMTADGSSIKFEMNSAVKGDNDVIPSFKVDYTIDVAGNGSAVTKSGTLNWQVQDVKVGEADGGSHQAQAEMEIDLSKLKDGDKITVGSTTYTFAIGENSTYKTASNAIDLSEILAKPTDVYDTTKKNLASAKMTQVMASNTEWTVGNGGAVSGNSVKLTFQSKSSSTTDLETEKKVLARFSSKSSEKYASTSFDVDVTKLKNGDTLTVGDTTYKFVDKNNPDYVTDGNATEIDLTAYNLEDGIKAANEDEVLDKIKAQLVADASTNKASVALDGKTFTLTTTDGASITTKRLSPEVKFNGNGASSGLTLQIGDTADSFNQLKINVGDMHTKALGIDGIDIGTQEGAQKAIQTVKDAINNVSSIRGDLGAYQNRLDHTANNLSVMAENIQDAESAIRDTDVADEMMKYVKNNILVQSAQAMLAQANQVPQGVLQLLG